MNGWIKLFADGTQEFGTDTAVNERLASWTLGRQDGMVGALVSNGTHKAIIEGQGNYWQSDDYESLVLAAEAPKLVKRRIQKKIGDTDAVVFVEKDSTAKVFRCRVMPLGMRPSSKFTFVLPISKEQVGQWLTLELDEASGSVAMKVLQEQV